MKAFPMPTNIDPDAQKKIIKEAIKEWLNEMFADFGRFTFYGIGAAALAGAVYLALRGQGWSK
jgi:hypothetical protein